MLFIAENQKTGTKNCLSPCSVGDYKLIVGKPGRYNNWYPAKNRPACNSKEAKQGYMFEERQLAHNYIEDAHDYTYDKKIQF